MDRVGIVILNYLNYEDTFECIDTALKQNYINKEIIVVDNGSNNGAYEKIEEYCKDLKSVYCIKSDENLGFARGNNLGIVYALKQLKCNHVLVVNNDTVFEDEDLIEKLVNAFEPGVGIIGPRIIAANKLDQNPIKHIIDKEATERHIRECTDSNNYKDSVFYRAYVKGKRIINKISAKENANDSMELVLHGACFMLTKEYFRYYPYLFPKTFLYYEENILTVLTRKIDLRKKYITNCYILHKEDQSTVMSFNNDEGIRRNYYVDSAKECLKLYDLSYGEIVKRYFKM